MTRNHRAIRCLLAAGVPVDHPDSGGSTALQHLMSIHTSNDSLLEEAALLLAAGADPRHASKWMKSAWDLAPTVPEDLRELLRPYAERPPPR